MSRESHEQREAAMAGTPFVGEATEPKVRPGGKKEPKEGGTEVKESEVPVEREDGQRVVAGNGREGGPGAQPDPPISPVDKDPGDA